MGGRQPFYRRQYLVNKKLQFQISFVMVLEVALVTFALSLILLYINDYYLGLITYFIGAAEAEQISLSDISKGMNFFLVGGIIGTSVIFSILGIFLSHRIAGPLFRLKRYMTFVRNGNYSHEIKFRKGDQLHDMADSFNEMVLSLDIRKEISILYIERLESIVRNIIDGSREKMSVNPEKDLKNSLKEITTILDDLREHKSFIYDEPVPENKKDKKSEKVDIAEITKV